MTKISRRPGTEVSASTMTRPALSSGEPSFEPSGDASTPAAQNTLRAGIVSSPARIVSLPISVTKVFVRTSTPSVSSCFCAFADRSSG